MGKGKCCGDPWVVVRSEVAAASPLAVPAAADTVTVRPGRFAALFFRIPIHEG